MLRARRLVVHELPSYLLLRFLDAVRRHVNISMPYDLAFRTFSAPQDDLRFFVS